MSMKPDLCTSLSCQNMLGGASCSLCSHAVFNGSGMVNGKPWQWEFSPYFGPTFLKKDGEPRKIQPGEGHPVWTVFNEWLTSKG